MIRARVIRDVIRGALIAVTILSCKDATPRTATDSTEHAAVDTTASRRGEIGKVVPDYGAVALTAGPDSLRALRGRVVLLNVWATWCIPCRAEMPDLQALHERYNAQGLSLVGVSIDESGDAQRVRDYAKERGVTYTLWHDPGDNVSGMFLANGVPATYLIGRDGTLRWRHLGPLAKDDAELNALLQSVLGEH